MACNGALWGCSWDAVGCSGDAVDAVGMCPSIGCSPLVDLSLVVDAGHWWMLAVLLAVAGVLGLQSMACVAQPMGAAAVPPSAPEFAMGCNGML